MIQHADDILVDFDQLDTMRKDGAGRITDIDGALGEMLDRGAILNRQMRNVQQEETCQTLAIRMGGSTVEIPLAHLTAVASLGQSFPMRPRISVSGFARSWYISD